MDAFPIVEEAIAFSAVCITAVIGVYGREKLFGDISYFFFKDSIASDIHRCLPSVIRRKE